jgi:hypothetical protein
MIENQKYGNIFAFKELHARVGDRARRVGPLSSAWLFGPEERKREKRETKTQLDS